MGEDSSNSAFLTQAERIEQLLRSRYGQWIPAYELAGAALQYCARINSIRKKLKTAGDIEEVENKTEWVSGQCRGSYRIRRKDASEPVKTESRHDRAKEFERESPPVHPPNRLAADDCFRLTPLELRR